MVQYHFPLALLDRPSLLFFRHCCCALFGGIKDLVVSPQNHILHQLYIYNKHPFFSSTLVNLTETQYPYFAHSPQSTYLSKMVNSTIRAIRVEENGDASVLKSTIIPRPIPQRNQVLVKIAYAGINYADVGQRSGVYPTPLPFTVGIEGSGVIVELGPDVEHGFKVGDRVTFIVYGAYTDYAVVDTVRLGKLPDHVSLELVCHLYL